MVEGFQAWYQTRVTEETATYYANVIAESGWPPTKNKHVKAWRQYIHYLFSIGALDWNQYQAYLLYLKTPTSNKHRTVEAVPIETIKQYKKILEQAGLGALHTLLLGGTRLKHVLRMAAEWKPDETVKHPTGRFEKRLYCSRDWCRYYGGIREGSKRTDYIYFPLAGRLRVPALSYRQLKDKLNKLGVKAGLYRKFANQKLVELAHQNNIPLDAAALIISRGLTVTGAHYLNMRDWADKLFNIYVEWLREQQLI